MQLGELEEMVVDAWPALHTTELDGWLLRASGGPSRRANSVATLGFHSARPLEEVIGEVEAWYRARGQPALFQVGPAVRPKELDQVLAARGYQTTSAAAFSAVPAFSLSALVRPQRLEVRVSERLEPAWLSVTTRASRFGADMEGLRGFFKRLGSRCRFATAFDAHGEAMACCLGIASEDWLGVYAMITLPEARRRGAARALLHGLAESALQDGMRELYLLVDVDNTEARALYASCGFHDRYTYSYRIQGTPVT